MLFTRAANCTRPRGPLRRPRFRLEFAVGIDLKKTPLGLWAYTPMRMGCSSGILTMPELGVNIDHVATVRQARRTNEPDPGGALGRIGRGRRHHAAPARGSPPHFRPRSADAPPNGHGQAEPGNGLQRRDRGDRLRRQAPDQATLVPERREEVTTEGGLDVCGQHGKWPRSSRNCRPRASRSACFSIPIRGRSTTAARLKADAVELHTGQYAAGHARRSPAEGTGQAADGRAMVRQAGHGPARRPRPDLSQRPARSPPIEGMHELNIGHSIVARAIMVGFEQAVREMKRLIA